MSREKALQEELAKAMDLRTQKEAEISKSVSEIYYTVTHPAKIIKDCIRDLASDKDLRSDIGKLALHALANKFTSSKTKTGFISRIVPSVINFFFRK